MKSKRETVIRIEEILSYLLSEKYRTDIKIKFRKEKYNVDDNKTRDIDKE